MDMLSFFRRGRTPATTADTAKERLQILLSHERTDRSSPEYLPQLQRDILEVIERYMNVGGDSVDIKLERGDELSTLEINIELPGARNSRPAGVWLSTSIASAPPIPSPARIGAWKTSAPVDRSSAWLSRSKSATR
ncbi:cell division topological specificity factor MinE [Amaricoccus sp. HAR-UPW-R2A-40]|nr:cell division topological specificity factor MinE [Amaricoccus sp. HAR-UPW-R2A-40]